MNSSAEPTSVPIPFRRLLSVETRKLFDTRSAKILTGVLAGLTVLAIVGRGLATAPEYRTLVGTAGIGFGTLLPVIGILSVTGEWRHRTALTTFALEPRRGRVLLAKCVPPLLTAVAASVFALLVAVPVTAGLAAVRDVPASWQLTPGRLLGWAATNVLLMAMALAVGMLLLNAPAAIVLCLSTTVVFSVVGQLGTAGATLRDWLDLNTTAAPLSSGGLDGAAAAHLAVAATCWIVLPMAAGALRVLRREVR